MLYTLNAQFDLVNKIRSFNVGEAGSSIFISDEENKFIDTESSLLVGLVAAVIVAVAVLVK